MVTRRIITVMDKYIIHFPLTALSNPNAPSLYHSPVSFMLGNKTSWVQATVALETVTRKVETMNALHSGVHTVFCATPALAIFLMSEPFSHFSQRRGFAGDVTRIHNIVFVNPSCKRFRRGISDKIFVWKRHFATQFSSCSYNSYQHNLLHKKIKTSAFIGA